MTAEEKKLSSWERSRLDAMPWAKWQEKFGISETEIIEKGMGRDLAQGRYTALIRVFSSGDGVRQDGDASLRAFQTTKDGEFQLEVQGVRESLFVRNIFGKDIPEAMQNDLKERGSAGPLDISGRQQYIGINPNTRALIVCPAASLENELQRRNEVFGYTLTDDDKALLAKGGVIKDADVSMNGTSRKADIHFDVFRQCLWTVNPGFAEKIGVKKAEGKEMEKKQEAAQQQQPERAAKKSAGVHM